MEAFLIFVGIIIAGYMIANAITNRRTPKEIDETKQATKNFDSITSTEIKLMENEVKKGITKGLSAKEIADGSQKFKDVEHVKHFIKRLGLEKEAKEAQISKIMTEISQ